MMKSIDIKTLPLGAMQANCYIIEYDQNCIIVDPGDQPYMLLKHLEEKKLNVKAILLTHGHFDHIGAIDPLYDQYHCPVYIHQRDYEMIYNDSLNLSAYYTPLTIKAPVIKVNDTLTIDSFRISFINLPGHTKGSCFIVFDDYDLAFSGDVLFKGSIGRYDFPTSSQEDTKNSLVAMYKMDKDYKIYPGHGDSTSLFYEKSHNMFFNS